jgi:hypothetical protein
MGGKLVLCAAYMHLFSWTTSSAARRSFAVGTLPLVIVVVVTVTTASPDKDEKARVFVFVCMLSCSQINQKEERKCVVMTSHIIQSGETVNKKRVN